MRTGKGVCDRIASPVEQPNTIRIGTSAFTAAGWLGTFYPADLKPSEYLSFYAQHFDTVEVDSTFYRIPSVATTRGWYAKTPDGFLFAAKIPQVITHEQCLVDSEVELRQFLAAMEPLGEKLGPLLFQFPYFNRQAFANVEGFLERLRPFLKKIPKGYRFALEIRNKWWIGPELLELLKEHKVALALIDHPWMPRPGELLKRHDPITSDFTYIRWLGDRKSIEEKTKSWDKVIVDRRRELEAWVEACRVFNQRHISIFGFANNHYAGHAPATVRQFWELWQNR
jgi:uncharacterized protein YecE (DUF72 family)